MLLLLFFSGSMVLVVLSIMLWNLFHWGTNPTVQYALLQFIEGDPSQVFSYNISLLNLGIGIGSFVGGILVMKDPSFDLSILSAIGIALVSFITLCWIRKVSVN